LGRARTRPRSSQPDSCLRMINLGRGLRRHNVNGAGSRPHVLIGKILRRIVPVLIVLVVFAGALGIKALGSSSPPHQPGATPAVDLETLLNDGQGDTTEGYFKPTSNSLVAVA